MIASTKIFLTGAAALPLFLWSQSPATAQSLDAYDYFLQFYNNGPNNLHFPVGQFIRFGASYVVPNGAEPGGTTGIATTTNVSTGAGISGAMFWATSDVLPNFFSGLIPTCTVWCSPTGDDNPANLRNPFTLTFANPGATPTSRSETLSLYGPGQVPFVNSITLSGSTDAPVFSWTPPAGFPFNGYRINIYQNNLNDFNQGGNNDGQISFAELDPGHPWYAPTGLAPNTQYTIAINVLQTRDGTGNIDYNNYISAVSKVYSNFELLPAGSPPVSLGTVTLVGDQVVIGYNLPVAPGVTYHLDPTVATGYIYRIGSGDPNFASVSLPDLGNSDPYSIYLWNGTSFVFDTTLAANTVFDFAPGGVSEFEVLGIDPNLGLDPNNGTAFISDLTFEGAGTFTGTMTPIMTEVPETSTWAMLLIGLAGLGFAGSRRSPSVGSNSCLG